MREIVAAQIGSTITNNLEYIRRGITAGKPIRLLSRSEMQFMSACDLGKNWDDLANARTLAIENDDGTFTAA